jgi:hypothetical protein
MTNKDNNTKFSYAYFHNINRINMNKYYTPIFAIRSAIKSDIITWFNADCFDESFSYETSWVFRDIR